jgi:adenylylsulfate kinase
LKGEIGNFTGVSDPYEEPFNPELVIESHRELPEQSLERLLQTLEQAGFISGKGAGR